MCTTSRRLFVEVNIFLLLSILSTRAVSIAMIDGTANS